MQQILKNLIYTFNVLLRMSMESFNVRLQQSFQVSNQTMIQSTQSLLTNRGSIQEILKNIQEQEKKKFIRKTESKYTLNESIEIKKKKNSFNGIKSRQTLKIPLTLSRMLCSYKMYKKIPIDEVTNRIYGAFLGFLIGDSVGAHIAHQNTVSENDLKQALLMIGGGTYNLGPAQGTDQTQICFSTAYGLINSKQRYDANAMACSYLDWIESKPIDLPTIFALSLNQIKSRKAAGSLNMEQIGQTLIKNSLKNAKHESNLGFIRLLPLIAWSIKMSESQALQLITNQMKLICPNQLVIETAIIYTKILRIVIMTGDHELAFYEASKWVYDEGSQKIMNLWGMSQKGLQIPSKGNMGKLKTAFTYTITQINKKQIHFIDSLLYILAKGGDTDSNCAIVMAMIGGIVGYNMIPNYFKHKISTYKSESVRSRKQKYWPSKVFEIVDKLLQLCPNKLIIDKKYD